MRQNGSPGKGQGENGDKLGGEMLFFSLVVCDTELKAVGPFISIRCQQKQQHICVSLWLLCNCYSYFTGCSQLFLSEIQEQG